MENWLLPNFLSALPGTLPFYTPPENNIIFLHQLFSVSGEIFPLLPLRAPLYYIVVSLGKNIFFNNNFSYILRDIL